MPAKEQLGKFTNRFYSSTKVTFSIVTTLVTTAIGLWVLNIIGVEARVAHTIGDFIRLVGESA
jgi:hypothetical protein